MKNSAVASPAKTWEKTKIHNLRAINPAAIMPAPSATTKRFGKACALLTFQLRKRGWRNFLREHREKQAVATALSSAKMTFSEALNIHLQHLDDNVTIKPGTRHYWRQIFVASQELAGLGRT